MNANIDNYPNYHVTRDGRIFNLANGLERKQRLTRGYHYCALFGDNGRKDLLVHRLVAKAYLEPVEGKLEVNHKDGNKSNNSVDNLEWCNRSENMYHAHEKELKGKLTRQDIYLIKRLIPHETQMDIATLFGVDQSHISNIKRGKMHSEKN
jgi:predicted XRE-type DNA-binding protein